MSGTYGSALLSEDRRYRYWLLRVWDSAKPTIGVIGINPSTADESADDPTIRKVVGFAKRLGFGSVLMLNVCAFRSTDPKVLRSQLGVGLFNSAQHLREYVNQFKVDLLVAAWGKNGQYMTEYCEEIIKEFPELQCWGCNSDGTPRHPLMLSYSTPLEQL